MKKTILAGILVLALGPMSAQAGLLRVDFSVTATDGPLNGTSSSGFFTFDSSVIPPGGGDTTGTCGTACLTELSFAWNGTSYDQNTANTGALAFDAAGNLTNFAICPGASAGGGGCLTGPGDDWALFGTGFNYTVDEMSGEIGCEGTIYCGSVEWSISSVPTPATLALLGLGLLGVGYRRRQRS